MLKKNQFSWLNKGFSLVEVIIALGIASAVSLGIATMLQSSNRTTKGISLNNEWVTLTGSLRALTMGEVSCTNMITAGRRKYNGGVSALVELTLPPKVAGGAELVMLSTKKPVRGIFATKIDLVQTNPDPGFRKIEIRPNIFLNQWDVYLDLEAIKTDSKGKALSNLLTTSEMKSGLPNPIRFTILTDPSNNNLIVNCWGDADLTMAACNHMGGIGPDDKANPKCQLPYLPIAIAGRPAAAQDPSASGAKIQLEGTTPGKRSPNDTAIGIDQSSMWFNSGKDIYHEFKWFIESGKDLLMTLNYSGLISRKKIFAQDGLKATGQSGFSDGAVYLKDADLVIGNAKSTGILHSFNGAKFGNTNAVTNIRPDGGMDVAGFFKAVQSATIEQQLSVGERVVGDPRQTVSLRVNGVSDLRDGIIGPLRIVDRADTTVSHGVLHSCRPVNSNRCPDANDIVVGGGGDCDDNNSNEILKSKPTSDGKGWYTFCNGSKNYESHSYTIICCKQ